MQKGGVCQLAHVEPLQVASKWETFAGKSTYILTKYLPRALELRGDSLTQAWNLSHSQLTCLELLSRARRPGRGRRVVRRTSQLYSPNSLQSKYPVGSEREGVVMGTDAS